MIRKINQIMTVVMCVLLTLFLISLYDQAEKNNYYSLGHQYYQVVQLETDQENQGLDLAKIINLANKYQVILVKNTLEDGPRDSQLAVQYLSVNDFETALITSGLSYQQHPRVSPGTKVLASTDALVSAKFLIKDFLGNDSIVYRSLRDLKAEGGLLDSSLFTVYYSKKELFLGFKKELAKLGGVELQALGDSSEKPLVEQDASLYLWLMVISAFLIYFLFESFLICKKAKKVGVMALLGISKVRITNKLGKGTFKLMIVGCVLIDIGLIFSLVNPPSSFWLVNGMMQLLFMIALYLINLLSVTVIITSHSINQLLKNQGVGRKLLLISYITKMLIMSFVSLSVIASYLVLTNLKEVNSFINDDQPVNNIGTFSSGTGRLLRMSQEEIEETTAQLFSNILNSPKNTAVFYVNFNRLASFEQETPQVQYFGEVDYNYLEREHLQIVDSFTSSLKGLSQEKGNYFLIPEGIEVPELLANYQRINGLKVASYPKYYYSKQEFYSYSQPLSQLVNNYFMEENDSPEEELPLKIKNPVFLVLDVADPQNLRSAYSNGHQSGIKVDLSPNKESVYQTQLLPHLEKVALETSLIQTSLHSYQEKNQFVQLALVKQGGLTILVLSFTMTVYLIISFEELHLTFANNKKIMTVKWLLGFSNYRIFSLFFKINLLLFSGTLFLTIGASLVKFNYSWKQLLLATGGLLLIDLSLLSIYHAYFNRVNLGNSLKGGDE